MGKRMLILTAAVLPLLFLSRRAAAQEVVVDPTHIGVAVENTASSLEEMITMIEEMFSLNGKIDDLYGLAEKVGDVADRFKEVGYLVDMTESYNDLLRRTYEYSARIREWADEGDIYGYEKQLRYLHRCERQGMKLFNQYMDYFRSLRTSDADKAGQAQKTIRELEEARAAVTREMDSAEGAREIAGSLSDAVRFFDKAMDPQGYVDTYRRLGDADYAASSWISVIRVVIGLMYMFLVVVALITIFRGQELGTMTGAMALYRWFIGLTAVWLLLEMFNRVII